jgi:hypothetical protein
MEQDAVPPVRVGLEFLDPAVQRAPARTGTRPGRRGELLVPVASIFNAFGSRILLFPAGPRILPTEDEDVSAAVAHAFRGSGIVVREDFGEIKSFEETPSGVRMTFRREASATTPRPRLPSSPWAGWHKPPG